MRPKNHIQARRQIYDLMRCKIAGKSPKTRKQLLKNYQMIGEILWRHHQIGIYQIKMKHVLWFFNQFLSNHTPNTCYHYWLRTAEILAVANKYQTWEAHLRGPWRNAKGQPFKDSNRGRKATLREKHIDDRT